MPESGHEPSAPRLHSRRAALRLGAAGLAGAAMAVACGAPDDDEEDGAEAGSLTLRSRAPAPVDASWAGRLQIGVLRQGVLGREPLAPIERTLMNACLVAVDPRTAAVHGDLAESVELADYLTVRFSLRPNVRFHPNADGLAIPLDAAAVQREFERRAGEGEFLSSTVIDRVEAVDVTTVLIHLRGPFSLLFEMLADAEFAAIRGEGRYVDFVEAPGAGAFVPAGRERLGDVLVGNPTYHFDGYPLLRDVAVLRFDGDRDADLAFAAGDIDARVHRDEQSRELAAQRDDVVRVERSSTGLVGLGLSLLPEKGGAPVRHVVDDRVRRAVSSALDRAAFAASEGGRVSGPVGPAHGADALPAGELMSHLLYVHDPAEARALLSAAGHEGLTFRIQLADESLLRAAAGLLTEQLRAGGFEARLDLLDPVQWGRSLTAGDFESTLFEFESLATPDLGLRLHTTRGLEGTFSPWGYSNPVYDEAVREALSALDPAERARRSRAAQLQLLDDVPAMFPIWSRPERASVASRVDGYEFGAYDFNASWLSAGWRVDDPGGSAGG
jgi:ABC-type transport system substrate-binding protein